MTRRSTKIQKDEEMTDKKPVRKVGRRKKEEVSQIKKANIKVKVSKSPTKPIGEKKTLSDKSIVLEEIVNKKTSKQEEAPKMFIPQLDAQAVYEREERKKILIMWVGVGLFMFLIAGFWIYDTKKIFEQNKLEAVNNDTDFSFEKLAESVKDVSGKIDEFKQEIAKASSTMATSTILTDVSTSTVATATASKPDLIVKELQEKLITSTELASTTFSTSSASSTESGKVKGVSEDRDIINELKNKLEK